MSKLTRKFFPDYRSGKYNPTVQNKKTETKETKTQIDRRRAPDNITTITIYLPTCFKNPVNFGNIFRKRNLSALSFA